MFRKYDLVMFLWEQKLKKIKFSSFLAQKKIL